jgi:hypothetical protein
MSYSLLRSIVRECSMCNMQHSGKLWKRVTIDQRTCNSMVFVTPTVRPVRLPAWLPPCAVVRSRDCPNTSSAWQFRAC